MPKHIALHSGAVAAFYALVASIPSLSASPHLLTALGVAANVGLVYSTLPLLSALSKDIGVATVSKNYKKSKLNV